MYDKWEAVSRARQPGKDAPSGRSDDCLCLLSCGLLAGPLALPAHAEGKASTFVAEGNLVKDGTLKVKHDHPDGAYHRALAEVRDPENVVGDRQYVQRLSDITATVKGAEVQPTITTDDRFTTVTVPTDTGRPRS